MFQINLPVDAIQPSPLSFAFNIAQGGNIIAHSNAALDLKPRTALSPELTASVLDDLANSAEPVTADIKGKDNAEATESLLNVLSVSTGHSFWSRSSSELS